jgi:hypothetical protein
MKMIKMFFLEKFFRQHEDIKDFKLVDSLMIFKADKMRVD